MGAATSAFAGVALAMSGIQQMSKGGTYNTLMGLAGIFGGIASVTGSLGSLGGMFGGGGAKGLGQAAQGVNFNPQAFSMPSLVNAPIPSFAGGGYTGNRPMLGGLDGRGGFMAMLHPDETVVPGNVQASLALRDARNAVSSTTTSASATADPFAATRDALDVTAGVTRERHTEQVLATSLSAPTKPLDIRYQSELINQTEYVTADQFQRGMAESAERGRALTLSTLRNSVRARRSVGM
jgi:hypothetical protein